MTETEIRPWLDKWVRVTLADGRILAGKLSSHNQHYKVMTPAPDKRESDENVTIQSGDQITTIEAAPEFGK
jgi:small nuclear ribonucleoprotein (snRNP)-like protein